MKAQKIAGWVLSVMVGGMLIMSSTGKFSPKPDYVQMLEHVGYQAATMPKIGVAELLSALLFLVPQTAFLGAILVTGYMGGAIATHRANISLTPARPDSLIYFFRWRYIQFLW